MKKLNKTLSVLLTFVMLFTTFCFFPLDLGAIEADAAISGIKIVVPETLYLTPSTGASTTVQYYINNNADGSVKTTQDTSAQVHITYPGAKLTSISAKTSAAITLPASITGLVGTTFGTSATSANGTFSLPAGINAGGTSLVEWTFVFDVNGKTQTHYAYSVAYAPWYQPVGAAAKAKGAWHNVFASSILWVSGVHGYSDGESNSRYYVQTANFLPMLGTIKAPANNNPETNWIQSGSNGLSPTVNYQSVEAGGTKYHARANSISPTANLTVDTSRYNNFNQIPNFSVGFMVTDTEASNGGSWYVSDFTGQTSSYYNGTDTGSSQYTGDYNSTGTKFSENTSQNSAGIMYNGTWNKAISGTASFRIKSATKTIKSATITSSAWNNNFVNISVTGANKGTLRTNVLNGTSYAKENYTSETWNTYYSALKTAATNLGNPVSSTVDTSALTTAESGLYTTAYFDANGGSLGSTPVSVDFQIGGAASQTFAQTTLISAYPATRTGYTFLGWAKDKNATSAPDNLAVGFNETVYAVWQANKYNVLFDNLVDFKAWNKVAGNGTVSDVTDNGFTITCNSDAGEATSSSPFFPVEPGKSYTIDLDTSEGAWDVYIFFCNEAGSWVDFADGPTNRFSNSTDWGNTFTAPDKAEVVKAQIRVDANGAGNTVRFENIRVYEVGTVADGVSYAAPVVVTYDSTYSLPTPTRENYALAGWFTAPNGGGTKITTGETVKITDTTRLYSHWTDANYYIAFNANTGSGSMDTVKANVGENYTLPANTFTKTGYNFLGWALDSSATAATYGNGAAVQLAEKVSTVTLYAVWAKNDYSINYVGGEGATGTTSPQSAKYDETVTLRNNGFTKTGYIFSGWTDGTNTYAAGQELKNLTAVQNGTVTLTAVWTPITYTINFDIAGATIDPVTVTYDEAASRLPDGSVFNKTGYTFGGWIVAGTDTTVTNDNYDTLVTVNGGNVTLTAVEVENSYTVEFNGNGATGGETASQTVNYTDTFTLNANGFNKTGYTFKGWAETENGEVKYADKATDISQLTAVVNGTVTLYAVWEANTYTVIFNNNDSAATGSMENQSFTYDEAQKLTGLGYAKEGWHFVEWNTSADGQGTGYADLAEVINLTADADGEVTLYAQWTINLYDVTFKYFTKTGEAKETIVEDVPHGTAFDTIVPADFIETYYVATASKDAPHYNFNAWENGVDEITAEAVFEAAYTEEAHEYYDKIGTSYGATCTEKGLKAEYCDCGYEYTEEIPALGHDWAETGRTATCTEAGVINYKCVRANCNATKQEVLEALGHIDGEWKVTTEAGCITKGEESHYCGRCNEIWETKEIAAAGHSFSATVVAEAPTCVLTGNVEYKQCENCALYFEADATVDSADGKATNEDFILPANGHKTVLVPAVQPKCEEDGNIAYYTCENCDLLFADADAQTIISAEDTVDPMTGHSLGELIAEKEATCEESGVKAHYKCSACDKTFDESKAELADLTIPAKGHSLGELIAEIPATCVATGIKAHYTCSACQKNFDGEMNELDDLVIPKNPDNHDLVTVPAQAETCEAIGWAEYQKCQREGCDYSTYVEIPAKGHDYESAVTTPVTCITDGVMTYTCKNDSLHKYTEDIVAQGHSFTDAVAAVAPGCTSTGMESYKTCNVCNKFFAADAAAFSDEAYDNTDSFVIGANGHNYEPEVTPPTCEEDGYTTYTCSACSDSYKADYVNKLGHTEGAAVIENDDPAECTVDGSYDEVVYCSVCNKELSRETKVHKAPGHTEAVKQENVSNATCTIAGSYDNVTYCSVCSEVLKTERVTGVTLPHVYEEKIADAAHLKSVATCAQYAVYYYDCKDCDANAKDVDGVTFEYIEGGYDAANHIGTTTTGAEDEVPGTCDTAKTWNEVTRCDDCNEIITSVPKTGEKDPENHVGETYEGKDNEVAGTCSTVATWDTVTYCADCNTEIGRVSEKGEKDPANHSTTETVLKNDKAATCHEKGYSGDLHCVDCDAVVTSGYVTDEDKNNHDGETEVRKEDTVPGTCVAEETWNDVTYCLGCGTAIKSVPQTDEKNPENHTGSTEVRKEDTVPGTCVAEETWNDVTYCLGCGEELGSAEKTGEKNPANHTGTPTKTVGATAPTCHTEGYTGDTRYTCCDALYQTGTSIPMTAHTPAAAVIENDVKATCTVDGSYDEVVYCAVEECHYEISRETKTHIAPGHTASEAVVENNVPATCTVDGSYDEVVYCSVCGGEVSRVTKTHVAPGHTASEAVVENNVPAACTVDGSYDEVVYCSVCGGEVSRVAKTHVAPGHKAAQAVIENEVAVKCDTDGSYETVVYCSVCNEQISREKTVIPATGHTEGAVVYENEVPATATENGKRDEVIYCTTCGKELSRETVVLKPIRIITFVMYGETVEVEAHTGDTLTPPEVSPYTDANGFVHQFKAWDEPLAVVSGDATYTAVYTEPCDYSELDALEETLNEVLNGDLVDDAVLEENKAKIEEVLARIEEINAERNTRDKSEQNIVDFVAGEIGGLIDIIYPDAGSTLVIEGSSVAYIGTVLDLKAIKMPLGTVLTDAQWTSSDDSIVFFSNGRLYAVGTGTVTLTATRGILEASKVVTIIEGGNTRGITFTSINNTHFIIEDYKAVYNSAIVYWSDDFDLRFRVRVYQSFMFEDYIVYINGQEAEPNAEGYYVVPAGSGDAIVTIAGAVIDTGDGEGETVTKWSFWEWLLNLFRKIINFFKDIFGIA